MVLDLNAGGLERLVADLIRCGDHARFEYQVLALRFLGRFAEGLEEFATLQTAAPMGKLSMVWPRALRAQLLELAPAVIHTHSGVWYKVARAVGGDAATMPIIHTDHGRDRPDPWQHRLVDWIASRNTAVVVAVSDVLAEQLRQTVVAHPGRVRTILNGVDTVEYAPRPDDGALRAELGIAEGVPIIGSIGRLEHIKGYDLMVEAFASLHRGWSGTPAPVLVVAGDGGEEERLRRRVSELGLEGRVFLLGWRKDLARLYRAFSIFAMTSRSEGTSVSLLEAMSSGRCPVVTPVGGNAAVLGAALQHRLVASLDPEDIAVGWREALRDEAARNRDVTLARARVVETFSLLAMTRAYEELYSSVRIVSPSPRRSAENPPSM